MNLIGLPNPDAAVLAGAVLVALLLDRLFGEPPARLHPVVAMGRYLGAVGRRVSRATGVPARPLMEFWGGALGWCAGAALVVAVAFAAGWSMEGLHPLAQIALFYGTTYPLSGW